MKQRWITLPEVPHTASPVPWLTSLFTTQRRGPYGRADYRGNCSGYLIKDLLRYFGATSVLDPMGGSGTCGDVCRELGLPFHGFDLRSGQDATNPESYAGIGPVDFIWMHPPYWKMIPYNDDPRCLSQAPTLEDFLERLGVVLGHCRQALSRHGKIAILIGGFSHRGRYMPLPHLTLQVALDQRLWPACTEIIRVQYGNRSARNRYRSSFIPGVHDVCLVFRKED